MAQRLVRRLCEQCGQVLAGHGGLGGAPRPSVRVVVHCHRSLAGAPPWAVPPATTGYAGRVGVYELVDVGPQVQ